MKVIVLGSSSKGNSCYVEMGNKKFLIDVGFTFKDMVDKLNNINVKPEDIDFIIVTHAHIDHTRCLYTFYRTYNAKIYMSKTTCDELLNKDKFTNYINVDDINNIDDLELLKVPLSHNSRGFGYVFVNKNESLVYITDTGMIHYKYHDILKNRTVYVIESNHDPEMEMKGNKNYYTKLRNVGDEGHLSNDACARYLSIFVGPNTKKVILAHISEDDNTYEMAYNTNREVLDKSIELYICYPDKMSDKETINV